MRCIRTTHWTNVFELIQKLKLKNPFLKSNSLWTYFTPYPRHAFAYSWRKPLGTWSTWQWVMKASGRLQGVDLSQFWREAEPMSSPQQIRHPQLHVALMQRVRDFLTTLLPKCSGYSCVPFSLLFHSPWSNLSCGNGRVMLTPLK